MKKIRHYLEMFTKMAVKMDQYYPPGIRSHRSAEGSAMRESGLSLLERNLGRL